MQVFCCVQCKKKFLAAGWIGVHIGTYHWFTDMGVGDLELCCALLEGMIEVPAALALFDLGVN